MTPQPSGLQVVLTGSDGATYIYEGGQPVNVHWGEQHPTKLSRQAVQPGEQVMAGQKLLESGVGQVRQRSLFPTWPASV